MPAPQSGVQMTMQSAATTGNGTVVVPPPSFRHHTFMVVGAADVSAGKVKIEAAHASDYAGTWALVGSEVTVGNGTVQFVTAEGIYPFLRARVSTTVEGATVSVYYLGAP